MKSKKLSLHKEEMNNFTFKTKKYVVPSSDKIVVKQGILYFCGKPASYIAYQAGSYKRLPTLASARSSISNVARCADSFRPDPRKYLQKTEVYRCRLIYKKKTDQLIAIDVDHKRFFYSPNISFSS